MPSTHRLADLWPDLVALADAEGTLVFLNQAGRELCGHQRTGARQARTFADLLGDGDAREFSTRARPVALAHGRWQARLTLRHLQTQAPIEVAVTAFPLGDARGEPSLVIVCRDLRPLVNAERLVRGARQRDPLTELLSRAEFLDRLEQTLAGRPGVGGSLVRVDVDNFGVVNAAFGNAFGDELLRELAARLRTAVAPDAVVGRLSGDEFAVLNPGADSPATRALCERLLDATRTLSSQITATVSAGYVLFDPFGAPDAGQLLTAADIALAQAKAAGGDRVASFSETATANLDWVRQVRRAIDDSRLVLHAQPLVALDSGATVGHELLIRMIDDDGGLAPPASFLTTAERFGLVGALDRWVMERALELYRDGHPVSVNLSARTLLDHTFAAWIREQTAEDRDGVGCLTIEVTETATVDRREAGMRFIELASGPRCGFALDDFGTGYATLAALREFPAGQLKIDRYFMADLADSERDRLLVESVVETAHKLGFSVVAEGIEDERVLAAARACGADIGQGYHLGRPVPVAEAIAL